MAMGNNIGLRLLQGGRGRIFSLRGRAARATSNLGQEAQYMPERNSPPDPNRGLTTLL